MFFAMSSVSYLSEKVDTYRCNKVLNYIENYKKINNQYPKSMFGKFPYILKY